MTRFRFENIKSTRLCFLCMYIIKININFFGCYVLLTGEITNILQLLVQQTGINKVNEFICSVIRYRIHKYTALINVRFGKICFL